MSIRQRRTFPGSSSGPTMVRKFLKRAHDGEEIILAKGGKPYARLVPLEEGKPRVPGIAKGRLGKEFFEPLPEEELKAWEE
ncbi:MAG: antitoxin [Actinobacteria bacterium]|nr:antitoxin [Actinomycetota bacterium]